MQLHDPGFHGAVFEVQRDGLKHPIAQFIPRIGFGKDGVPERASAITTLLRITDLKDEFHDN